MKVYAHRRDRGYLRLLAKTLELDSLKRSARKLSASDLARFDERRPASDSSTIRYERICDVSFLGISASTLLDPVAADAGVQQVAENMRAIFEHHHTFAADGIWLRLRFLFIYPYSTHFMSIVGAAITDRRSVIQGESIHPSKQENMHVNHTDLTGSLMFTDQQSSLKTIQRWAERYDWHTHKGRSIAVRFTPLSTNLCCLIVNDRVFFDSYILAKDSPEARNLCFSPLTALDSNGDPPAFARLVNHFSYLWQHNITLNCKDATSYVNRSQDSLAKVRPPHQITFSKKTEQLVKSRYIQEDERRFWEFRAKKEFMRHVAEPRPDTAGETIFISCSWTLDNPTTRPRPNKIALCVKKWIANDITSLSRRVAANLVEVDVGSSLPDKIYAALSEADMAIVIFTDDFEYETNGTTVHGSKPNCYHELGYLMARLKESKHPIFVAVEDGVEKASNVLAFEHEPILNKTKASRRIAGGNADSISMLQACTLYVAMLRWIGKTSQLLDRSVLLKAIDAHKARILRTTEIRSDTSQELISNLDELLDEASEGREDSDVY